MSANRGRLIEVLNGITGPAWDTKHGPDPSGFWLRHHDGLGEPVDYCAFVDNAMLDQSEIGDLATLILHMFSLRREATA